MSDNLTAHRAAAGLGQLGVESLFNLFDEAIVAAAV